MGPDSPSDRAGAETTHAYDLADRRIETARPKGGTWVYVYGAADRLVSVADPESNTTTYVYEPNGNRTEQTDARQHTTRFEFDQRDRLELRRYHVGPAKFDSTPGASSPVHTRLHPHVFEKDQSGARGQVLFLAVEAQQGSGTWQSVTPDILPTAPGNWWRVGWVKERSPPRPAPGEAFAVGFLRQPTLHASG